MKIRFSKSMAAALAVCVGTFSGISALAAEPGVYTTTTYDYNNAENVQVVSHVQGGDPDAQVTYLVSTGTGESLAIKYIDQATLDASGNATFTFNAPQADIYAGTVTARYGSDQNYQELPNFKFNAGANYLSKGTATCTVTKQGADDYTLVADGSDYLTDDFAKVGDVVVTGQVSGDYTEYGIKISDGTTTYDFPAMGSIPGETSGAFVVIISGLTEAQLEGCTITGYATKTAE